MVKMHDRVTVVQFGNGANDRIRVLDSLFSALVDPLAVELRFDDDLNRRLECDESSIQW